MIMTKFDFELVLPGKHAYFIGVGGVGMSAVARVLRHRGLRVSGSDSKAGRMVDSLRAEGIQVYLGQKEAHLSGVDFIVYSSAIQQTHLELETARKLGIPIYHRAEVLAALFNRADTSIAVTGTHGKTTTTSMISYVMESLGKHPTCLVGGDVLNFKTNTVLGGNRYWVAEADESDRSHELYSPSYAIVTNLEQDHIENYPSFLDLEQSFERFVANAQNPGAIIYPLMDRALKAIVENSGKPHISFGFTEDADFCAANIEFDAFGSAFDLLECGIYMGRYELSVPGLHNVANALAAIALFAQLGLDFEEIKEPLAQFKGARRRLEVKYNSEEMTVIDDYAHHPTEVMAAIDALKKTGKRLTVVFQPHRFTRTRFFFKEFGEVLSHADDVILTEVYSAGELNPEGTGVDLIYREVCGLGHQAVRVMDKKEVSDYLSNRKEHEPSIIAFLGAGDIGEVADEFANRFKSIAAA